MKRNYWGFLPFILFFGEILYGLNVYAQDFTVPLVGTDWYLSQKFGAWNDDWGGYHLGNDFVVKDNSELPVYCAGVGLVKHVASHNGYGYVVIVEHTLSNKSKVCSVYGHLRSANITTVDKKLNKGDLLGYNSPLLKLFVIRYSGRLVSSNINEFFDKFCIYPTIRFDTRQLKKSVE